MGGCHGPSNYERRTRSLQGYAKRHYTRKDVEALLAAGRVDVLPTHDAPAGVVFERHRRGAGWASDAAGLDELVLGLRLKVCFFGHHHVRVSARTRNLRGGWGDNPLAARITQRYLLQSHGIHFPPVPRRPSKRSQTLRSRRGGVG